MNDLPTPIPDDRRPFRFGVLLCMLVVLISVLLASLICYAFLKVLAPIPPFEFPYLPADVWYFEMGLMDYSGISFFGWLQFLGWGILCWALLVAIFLWDLKGNRWKESLRFFLVVGLSLVPLLVVLDIRRDWEESIRALDASWRVEMEFDYDLNEPMQREVRELLVHVYQPLLEKARKRGHISPIPEN